MATLWILFAERGSIKLLSRIQAYHDGEVPPGGLGGESSDKYNASPNSHASIQNRCSGGNVESIHYPLHADALI